MSELPPPPPPPPSYGPPPGYVPYQQSVPTGGFCSPIGTLTKWLVGLLSVGIGASALSIIVQVALRNNAADFLDGKLTPDTFTSKIAPYVAVAALAAFAGLAQLVILTIWTFRIARNAQVLGRFDQKFKPGATIAVNLLGSCTLGILNFFMWRELWRASDPDAQPGDPTWRERALSPLIAIHLGLNLAGIAVSLSLGAGRIFGQFDSTTNDADFARQLQDQLPSIVIGGLLTLAASAVFVVFVRQLAQRHMRASGER